MKLNKRCTHKKRRTRFRIIWTSIRYRVLGLSLSTFPPTLHGESSIIEITLEEIEYEIIYWKSTVVCYVLGAHPPFEVLKGFIQRLWAKHGINKIVMLKNEIIQLGLTLRWGKYEVIQGGIYHCDNSLSLSRLGILTRSSLRRSTLSLFGLNSWSKLQILEF